MVKYTLIDPMKWNRKSTYEFFSTFSNPCYGFDVEMDITKLYHLTKERKESFFINFLYIVTVGMNKVDELRLRIVGNEIRLYEYINPTYTVMTNCGTFENCGHPMTFDYHEFYKLAHEEIEKAKKETKIKEGYNDCTLYNDFYMTCIPWISLKSMTHPLPDNNKESSSCPRVCWDKYRKVGDKVLITLNITVSHVLCDGYPLSKAFNIIQDMLDNAENYLK